MRLSFLPLLMFIRLLPVGCTSHRKGLVTNYCLVFFGFFSRFTTKHSWTEQRPKLPLIIFKNSFLNFISNLSWSLNFPAMFYILCIKLCVFMPLKLYLEICKLVMGIHFQIFKQSWKYKKLEQFTSPSFRKKFLLKCYFSPSSNVQSNHCPKKLSVSSIKNS